MTSSTSAAGCLTSSTVCRGAAVVAVAGCALLVSCVAWAQGSPIGVGVPSPAHGTEQANQYWRSIDPTALPPGSPDTNPFDIAPFPNDRLVSTSGQVAGTSDHETYHRHELSLVLAGTWQLPEGGEQGADPATSAGARRQHELTLGAEYEIRINQRFGAGATVERVTGVGNWLVVFPAYLHVVRGLKLAGGPGFEHRNEHGDFLAVVRVGVMYAIEVAERYSITPAVAFDFSSGEHSVVYGVNFGVGF